MKKFLTVLFTLALALVLVGCNKKSNAKVISVWVGEESTEFYQKEAKAFLEANPDLDYTINVIGANTGTAGGAMTADNTACGDIVTAAHDNIGKMLEKGVILPFTNKDLIAQVQNDNPESYQNVIFYNAKNASGATERNLYGVPYISQALFLFYNKSKVSAQQATTFEGLITAAKAAGSTTKAFTITGTDGFNYSFNLLAQRASDGYTSLKLFENAKSKNSYVQGDDEVASLAWAHRVFNDANGGLMPNDSGWASNLTSGACLSVIGGAWHFQAAKAALGDNLGIIKLPTYTLTADDVAGTSVAEGTVMQAGTFADCKAFCINANVAATYPEKIETIEKLIMYFSSKEVQLRSYLEASNVPAYKTAVDDIEARKAEIDPIVYDLAVAQIQMAQYGIPQPFVTGTLNTKYYSLQAPDYYKDAIIGKFVNSDKSTDWIPTTSTGGTAREALYVMEYIWKKAEAPKSIPATLPTDID